MNTSALIFMGISWLVVILVNLYCFAKVFRRG